MPYPDNDISKQQLIKASRHPQHAPEHSKGMPAYRDESL
jgi:hypothetical protein